MFAFRSLDNGLKFNASILRHPGSRWFVCVCEWKKERKNVLIFLVYVCQFQWVRLPFKHLIAWRFIGNKIVSSWQVIGPIRLLFTTHYSGWGWGWGRATFGPLFSNHYRSGAHTNTHKFEAISHNYLSGHSSRDAFEQKVQQAHIRFQTCRKW